MRRYFIPMGLAYLTHSNEKGLLGFCLLKRSRTFPTLQITGSGGESEEGMVLCEWRASRWACIVPFAPVAGAHHFHKWRFVCKCMYLPLEQVCLMLVQPSSKQTMAQGLGTPVLKNFSCKSLKPWLCWLAWGPHSSALCWGLLNYYNY